MARKPILEVDDASEAEEVLAQIEAAEERRMRSWRIVEGLKEQLKEAKEDLDMATSELCRLARVRKESSPLFDQGSGDEQESD